MSGLQFWSYHLFNFAIHIISALALYGIARRTFLTQRLRPRFERDAVPLAFVIALLWAIHPLQTASVTYVVQRCESMMGMFFLLTLYCVIRSTRSFDPGKWNVRAIVFCALGMGTKQVMIAAPIMILIDDRTFICGSIAGAIQARGRLYAGLLATCAILATSMLDKPPQGVSAGFTFAGVTPYHYALTQCAVIPHYLGLALWPQTLCLDYAWPFAQSVREVLPGMVLIGVLLLATLVAVLRNSPWGFVGAWFFVILAPSSSIMPIQDSAFEHRMYLSLASVVVVVVIALHALARALAAKGLHPRRVRAFAGVAMLAITLALGVRTVLRNFDYGNLELIWRQVLALYPDSQRANNNLGNALAGEAKHAEAVVAFEKCVRLNPDYTDAHFNLGVELNNVDRREEAVAHYKRALELNPSYLNAHAFMADILMQLDRVDEAVQHFEAEFKRDPTRKDVEDKLRDARNILIPVD